MFSSFLTVIKINLFFQMEGEELSEKKILLAKRSQEQLQEILRRKQSLSLNLKRSLPASLEDRSSCSEDMVSTSDIKSFQDACNRKLKLATALSLINQDLPNSIDTSDTFHTAAADSPPFIGLEHQNGTGKKIPETLDDESSDADLDFQTSTNEIQIFGQDIDDATSNSTATTAAMGQTEKSSLHSEGHNDSEKCSIECDLEDDKYLDADDSLLDENEDMKTINQRIVRQRLLVMKCMESSSPSNEELNRQIDILQDLRKQQIELEVSLLEQRRKSRGSKDKNLEEGYIEEMKAGSEFCNFDEKSINSHANMSNASTTIDSNMFKGKRSITDEDDVSRLIAAKVPSSRGYSSVYLTVND